MIKSFFKILEEQFGVSEEDYSKAEVMHDESGEGIGNILVANDVVSEKDLLKARSIRYDILFLPEISVGNIRADLPQGISIQFLKKYVMVPLDFTKKVSSPAGNFEQHEELLEKSDCVIAVNDPSLTNDYQPVLSTKEAILAAINLSYDRSQDSAEQLVQDMEENGSSIIDEIEETADLLDDTSDAPIIKLVNHIISQSIKAGASDIHIEPYQDSFKVRYRVDGILYDMLAPPKWIQPALISRVKVMARMNIAEKRLPQDGRIEVKKGNEIIDIRVSTVPITFGERVVLRLLNKTSSLLSLTDLGFEKEKLYLIKELIASPNGIILITGPTGSGKTTSLYAILSSINKPDINIITIEDPVEYQIEGIGQIQVNPKIDLTFARGLRSIMRQDPDVMLVGEIRDRETADIAVQSALTGHLVFSTLHTNDAASAITRLVDIGIEPFLISSSVLAVMAQRLIRVLCTECREPYVPDEYARKSIGIDSALGENEVIYLAKGCDQCFHTGYKGRINISEILVMDSRIKKMVLETFDSNRIKKEALKQGMESLRKDG
ncbi:MAG: Flp pilus assembly complex ATPase component TadA, partial [Deltaproteobacteria bacterium]|nr:Flp pilus assembly complex ATPase component TadA [Deltaproteobacteria bacterium]